MYNYGSDVSTPRQTHRDALLEAAKRLLRERDYGNITARDLVAASNTNLGSIGYHFGSKEALLNEAIGQQGSLPGVFVQKKGNQLIVSQVDKGSAAQGKLQKGDVLSSLVVLQPGAKPPRVFQPLPLDYYNVLWDVKPGTKVGLQIERQGAPHARLTPACARSVRAMILPNTPVIGS